MKVEKVNKGKQKQLSVKGISLIVLVISIIIMIVLATTMVLSITNSGILEQSNTAVKDSNVSNAKEELQTKYVEWLVNNPQTVIDPQDAQEMLPLNKYNLSEDEYIVGVVGGVPKVLALDNPYKGKTAIQTMNLSNDGVSTAVGKVYTNDDGGYDLVISGRGRVMHRIGEYNIEKIYMLNGITEIGQRFFSGSTTLKKVCFPQTLKSIGSSAFANCSSLEMADIPDSIENISDSAFSNCTSLANIRIPKNLVIDVSKPFSNTAWLNNLKASTEGLLIINGTLLSSANVTGEVVIPSNVVVIANSAFKNNVNITKVIIPDSVQIIGYSAFSGCTALEDVIMQSTLTDIGMQAFYNTPWLASIVDASSKLAIVNNVVIDGSGCTGDVEIPDGVIKIGSCAFRQNTLITSITMPLTLKEIGMQGFYAASNLNRVTLQEGISIIGKMAFFACSKLSSMNIPTTVTSIGQWALGGVPAITGFNNGMLIINNVLIEVLTIPGEPSLTGIIEIPANVIKIEEFAFSGVGNQLTGIIIPESVKYIGRQAFDGGNYSLYFRAESQPDALDEEWYYNFRGTITWGYTGE